MQIHQENAYFTNLIAHDRMPFMVMQERPVERGETPTVRDFARGSLDALIAQTAQERGLSGINARSFKPKGGGSRVIRVELTHKGGSLFDQIRNSPQITAWELIEKADKEEQARYATGVSPKERTRLGHAAASLRERAANILGLDDVKKLPHLGDAPRRTLVEHAVIATASKNGFFVQL